MLGTWQAAVKFRVYVEPKHVTQLKSSKTRGQQTYVPQTKLENACCFDTAEPPSVCAGSTIGNFGISHSWSMEVATVRLHSQRIRPRTLSWPGHGCSAFADRMDIIMAVPWML